MPLLSILSALLITLVGLPLARRVAQSSGLVLGGIPIITGTLIGGVLVGGDGLGRTAAAVGASGAVGLLGLVSDDRAVTRQTRLVVEALAALAVVFAGIRLGVTGVAAFDVALTVLLLVGVTTAFKLLDAEDGLAAGVGALAAAAAFVIAALGDQQELARFCGALAGACVAYLVYSGRPARIRLGNSGSLFIGFAVGVAAIELQPRVDRAASALVPLLLLAVPLLNIAVVVFGRARRDVALAAPAPDHLVHRYASRGRAVAGLIGIELALAVLAVMVVRSMVSWAVGGLMASAVLLTLLASALRTRAHTAPVVGLPRPVRVAALGVGALFVVATVAAAAALVAARGPLRNGADTASAALNAVRDGDYQRASVLFADSERSFSIGRSRLEGPLPSLGLVVPVVAPNVKAARLLAGVGADLAATGRTMAREIRPEALRMQGGAVPLREIARVAPALRDAADVMGRAERRIDDAELAHLVGPVRDAVRLVGDRLASVSGTAQRAADAADLAPAILGDDEARRYLLVIQNNAEARATGGFLGNYGELVADNGRVSLVKFGSLDNLRDEGVPFTQRTLDAPADFTKRFSDRMAEIKSWAHVNITPDFPTAARLMQSLYPQSGGQPIDGVIAVDAVGLSGLLKLTGPVDVAGWPVPLSAGNIVSVTTREQYEPNPSFDFEDYDARRDFLGAVAETVWRRVSSSDLGTPYAIADALGPATGGRHIQLALRAPREARLVRDLGIAGAVGVARSDSLLVVNHNAGGNKLDVYLDREITYRVRLAPDVDGTAEVTGVLDVKLRNRSPATGLPVGVLGASDQPVKPGENFSLTSLYSPLGAAGILVGGKPYPFRSDAELSRLAHSTFLRVAPMTNLTMKTLLGGRIRLVDGNRYVLDLLHQPRIGSDRVTVAIEVADGWEIVRGTGLRKVDGQHAKLTFDQLADRSMSLELRQTGISGLWAALFE